MPINLSENTRAYVYRVLLAVSALLVFYGVLDETSGPMWLGLAVAALGGNGLASANTNTREPFDPADDLRGP